MKKFIKVLTILNIFMAPTIGYSACVITGCNGELCTDTALPNIGICQWKDEYACYKQYGVCGTDANGNCAWQQTQELADCLTKLQQVQEGTVQRKVKLNLSAAIYSRTKLKSHSMF